eukprot:COSAG02_NODE_35579_length_466_cov_0.907357_2_plen_118_part_01
MQWRQRSRGTLKIRVCSHEQLECRNIPITSGTTHATFMGPLTIPSTELVYRNARVDQQLAKFTHVGAFTIERIAEMRDINWSLGCLKECIRLQRDALASRSPQPDHIPYRRSKLTMLL